MSLKPGPKRIAESTGEPDKRQRDNKKTPGNTDKLKPGKSSNKSVTQSPAGLFFQPLTRIYHITPYTPWPIGVHRRKAP